MADATLRRPRPGWVLIALGAFLGIEGLLAARYNVGGSGTFGSKSVLLLALGAGAALAGAFLVRRGWTGWPSEAALSKAARACAPFLLAFAVYVIAYAVMSPVETGDQPHYELEALSLAYDQDRDLTNDYASEPRVRMIVPKGFDSRHAYQYEPGGPFISVHHVGLPLLLTPAVPFVTALTKLNPSLSLWPFHVVMMLIAALSAQLLYLILSRLSPGRRWLRRAVWASIVFSPPLLIYANQVFPEGPSALLALFVAYALLMPASRGRLFAAAMAAAALPWLHVRFLPAAGLLALALAYVAHTELAPQGRTRAAVIRTASWTVGPLVVSVIAMCAAFEVWHGSPLPDAQYRFIPTEPSLSSAYMSLSGGLWSSERGWLPYAPIFLLALAALPLVARRFGRPGLFGLAIGGAYLAIVTWQGIHPGFSFPGRFEVILMPFLAIPLLLLVQQVRWGPAALAVVGALTFALAVALVVEPIPAIAGVPGQTGPFISHELWRWFVDIWPSVEYSEESYPDLAAVLGWSAGLLVLGLLVARSARDDVRRARRRPRTSRSGRA